MHPNVISIYYSFVRSLSVLAAIFATVLTGCYHGSKPPSIGRPAPDFTVRDSERSATLSEFRGKIVVLNFWASWCPPCVEELPSLVQLQKQLQDKNVTVIGISVDEDPNDYHKFLKDHGVDFLTVREGGNKTGTGVLSPTANQYGTFKIPETYIIDRKGIIRRKFIGPVDWSQTEIVEYLSRLQ
jgi:peroxiredoxin